MRGSTFSGTLECWRDFEEPLEVDVSLRIYPVHPSEGRGYEVDLLSSNLDGKDFPITDAELERAVQQFTEAE